MNKQLASITVAIFLGFIVMLMPILTYTQFLGSTGDNTLGTASSEQRDVYESTSWKTLDEAAQTLGKMDTGAPLFPTSLIVTILIAATSTITAIIASVAIERKFKLAVRKLIIPIQKKKW